MEPGAPGLLQRRPVPEARRARPPTSNSLEGRLAGSATGGSAPQLGKADRAPPSSEMQTAAFTTAPLPLPRHGAYLSGAKPRAGCLPGVTAGNPPTGTPAQGRGRRRHTHSHPPKSHSRRRETTPSVWGAHKRAPPARGLGAAPTHPHTHSRLSKHLSCLTNDHRARRSSDARPPAHGLSVCLSLSHTHTHTHIHTRRRTPTTSRPRPGAPLSAATGARRPGLATDPAPLRTRSLTPPQDPASPHDPRSPARTHTASRPCAAPGPRPLTTPRGLVRNPH